MYHLATMHSITDGQTDRQTDNVTMLLATAKKLLE